MRTHIFRIVRRLMAALIVSVAAAAALVPTHAKADPDSVEFFYDSLEPDGRWVDHWKYGRVWYPRDVDDDWRPYTRGRWVNTEDYGWYWESNERFGWATYHYGRWDLDEDYGWIWIPGRDWGPAWVDWRHGGGHVGWAPLPPAVVWSGSAFDYGGIDIVSVRYRPIWCFVEERRFISGDVYRYAAPPARNVTIINQTTNITNYTVVNNTFVNKSVNVTRIEAATKTVIKPVQIVQATAPTVAPPAGKLPGSANRQPAQVAVFRPEIKPGAQPFAKTALPPGAPGQPGPAVGAPGQPAKGQPQTGQPGPKTSAPVPPGPAVAAPAHQKLDHPQPAPQVSAPAVASVPVLPKGGYVKSGQPPAQTNAAAAAETARLRALEQRQAQEAARQRREQVVERYTPSARPRPDIQQKQAAERQELQRIQENRRVVVQNRAAIPQPPQQRGPQPPVQRAAAPPAKPAPAPYKKAGEPGQPGQQPPPR